MSYMGVKFDTLFPSEPAKPSEGVFIDPVRGRATGYVELDQ